MTNKTQIKIIIVGAGLAGLLCALECQRQGFTPIILESRDVVQPVGDFITIGPSAIRAFQKWPKLSAAFHDASYKNAALYFHKKDGELGAGPHRVGTTFGENILRADLHRILMETVQSAGIDIRQQHHVVEYMETKTDGQVRLRNGEILTADLVVAADGIKTKSWTVVDAQEPRVYSSGSAVFRASMPTSLAMEIPSFRKSWDPFVHGETMHFFIGSDRHGTMVVGKEKVCWGLMHPDDATTSTESWTATTSTQGVLDMIDQDPEPWSSEYRAVVAATPPGSMIHWRLLWRDLQEGWTSPNGRLVQIGDAAHAFLPTSVNGGTQSFEDAVSLACCLRLAIETNGKEAILEAVRIHNRFRLDRVGCCQEVGFKRRHAYYNVDWEAAKKDITVVASEPPEWLYKHNPETYAAENFAQCRESLRKGEAFQNTNVPLGYRFKMRTIEEMERE